MPIDDRRVTLKDIAEKTGFTVNTVSQALRGSPKLREETKAAIRAAAKELGYVHNALAGSLRSGSSRTIAIIVGDTSNLRFSIQLHAFELAFRTLGYQVIVMNTDETAQYELDAVKNAVRSSVDGVLLCPCQKSRAAIDLLESCRTPYVLFGRCYDDLPAVIWDDERGGYLAGQQLAQAGCRHILMLNVPDSISSARERESGFRRALSEAELTPHLLRTAPGGADLEPALGRYLDRYGCPDGIFAFSDLLALDAACCLQGRGIRIPQDVRLIGFDDILSHIRLPFPLSSVSAWRPASPWTGCSPASAARRRSRRSSASRCTWSCGKAADKRSKSSRRPGAFVCAVCCQSSFREVKYLLICSVNSTAAL